jgi:hypothetical protein
VSITHLLNRTAVWQRNTPTGDHGRFVETPVTLDPALPVRLQIASASEQTVGYQERAQASHVVFTDPETTLRYGDLLTIDSVRYKVLSKEPPSKPEHHLRYKVQEQQESSGVFP